MRKEMKKIVIIAILIGACIVYFYYLSLNSNKPADNKKTEEVAEAEKLINKDLDESYPKTPRETVKFYSRIITVFYNEKYTEDEQKLLAVQAQKLMDDELLEHNKFDEYYENLCEDIKEYKENNRKISSYLLDSSADVVYKTFQEKEYAYVNCIYFTKGKEGTSRSPEQYVLRKDEEGKWKILFWKLIEEETDDE